MFEANKATFKFLKEYKLVSIIIIIALSLLFATSMFLHGMSRRNEMELNKYSPYTKGTYRIYFRSADKASLDSIVKSVTDLKVDIHDFVVRGSTRLVNEKGAKLDIDITGCYEVNTPVSIIRGTDDMSNGKVLIHAWAYSDVFGLRGSTIYDKSDSDHLIFEKSGERKLAGVVYYPSPISFWGVIVSYDQFFDLAEECNSIEVAFQKPLSKDEESTFINSVVSNVKVDSVQYPSSIVESSKNEGNIQLGMYRFIIVICMFFAMMLFSYLYQLRKRELIILRMVGGGNIDLVVYIFSTLFQIVFAATLLGLLIVGLFSSFLRSIYIFQYMSINQVINDIFYFWLMTLLIGILQLALANFAPISSASESI